MVEIVQRIFNRYAPKASSLRNVLTLVSGTAIAQAVPLLISPILSRIYTPYEFGIFTLYLSISQVVAAIATGRYELAIVLPRKHKQAVNIFFLCLIIAGVLSLLSLLIISLGYEFLSGFINKKSSSPWLYLLPLSILASGVFNAFNYFYVRQKNYSLISFSNVAKSGTSSFTQVALGAVNFPFGLIIGQVVGNFASNLPFLNNFSKKRHYSFFRIKEIQTQAKIHSDFPKFSLWGIFLNTFSQNFINFFLSTFYSPVILGYYSYGFRYLSMPSNLVGNSFGQVYMQEIAEARKKAGKADKIFLSALKKLVVISLPFVAIGFFLIEDLFIFIFGEQWEQAGFYAQIMLPLIFFRFISTPLSITANVFEKQKISLLIHSGLFLTITLTSSITFMYSLSTKEYLILNSFLLSLFYVVVLAVNYLISKGKIK